MSDWIVSNPGVLGGKPCITGTRVSVEHILDLFASSASSQDVLVAHPQITAAGLAAALEYAARALRNEVVWDIKIPA